MLCESVVLVVVIGFAPKWMDTVIIYRIGLAVYILSVSDDYGLILRESQLARKVVFQ